MDAGGCNPGALEEPADQVFWAAGRSLSAKLLQDANAGGIEPPAALTLGHTCSDQKPSLGRVLVLQHALLAPCVNPYAAYWAVLRPAAMLQLW